MTLTQADLEFFAQILFKKIEDEFSNKHLSGNLVRTLKIDRAQGIIRLEIPAPTYNMLLYQSKGVIVHYGGNKSYASKLDETGSEFYVYPFGTRKGSYLIKPHNHKDFVEKVIQEALQEFIIQQNNKFTVGKVTTI